MPSSLWGDGNIIEAFSPLVRYTPDIARDGGLGDPKSGWVLANETTYLPISYTFASGVSLRVPFYGTSVGLFGISTCEFKITVDKTKDIPPSTANGTLAQIDGLLLGYHQAEINVTSCPGSIAGVPTEFQFWNAHQTAYGASSEALTVNKLVDDTDPSITYDTSWTLVANPSTTHFMNTLHDTTSPGASFTYAFKDSAYVAITGALKPIGTSSASYNITLDGQTSAFNSFSPIVSLPTVLFFQGGLDPNKNYTITGTNLGNGYLELDTIFTHGPKPASGSGSSPPRSNHRLSHRAIIAIGTALGLLLLLLLLILLFWLKRHRRRRTQTHETTQQPNATTVTTPTSDGLTENESAMISAPQRPEQPQGAVPIISNVPSSPIRTGPEHHSKPIRMGITSDGIPELSYQPRSPIKYQSSEGHDSENEKAGI